MAPGSADGESRLLAHHNNAQFVALALLVAIFGSWTALDLFRRVRSHIGQARRVWLGTAAVAMGVSIWSMHFIAMLGFDPGSPVRYDLGLTVLSLALAIAATAGAFVAAAREPPSRRRLLAAGAVMGVGICLMHYVGMAALRSAVSLGYNLLFVAASFLIAVGASTAALLAAARERSAVWRAAAAVTLGLAIAGMHYTAMAGLKLTPAAGATLAAAGAPPLVLSVGVAGGTLVILLLALMASLYDQRVNVLSALEGGSVGYWEIAVRERNLQVSRQGKVILGYDPDAPFTYEDLTRALSPEDLARRERLLAKAVAEGGGYDAEYQLQAGPGAGRWVNVRARVIAGADGRPRRIVGIVIDVTDRRHAFAALADSERRQRLLIDELNHRVKNTLSTVQSIARQTAKGAASMDGFRAAFDARLIALSQTHNALTRGGWEGARLRELLDQELAPYASDRCALNGEDVTLPPRQALAIGLVLHELATNAAKYGALHVPSGAVSVSWTYGPDGLDLRWVERGGPPVSPPKRRGFGSRLLKAAIEAENGGKVDVRFEEAGVECRICMPPAPEPPGSR